MKRLATLTFGATAMLSALGAAALAQEAPDDPDKREIVVADREVIVSNGDGDRRTVRMVVEAPHMGDDEDAGLCVFVPAGDEAAGAISCPGGNVRIFEFGGGHGRQFIMGDRVVSDEEIRALVEARLAEVNARLAEREAWEVEVVDRFDSEEYQSEMERLETEMEALSDNLEFDFEDPENLTEEERDEFNREMQRFGEQMAAFGQQMARLQTEVMAEAAAEMARLRESGVPVTPAPPGTVHWFGAEDGAGHSNRQIIRVSEDGEEHVTIIEHGKDEDGQPRITIRTTDPDSIEVMRLDPDELDREND